MSHNPFTFEAFAEWVATQPNNRCYNYMDIYGCAGALYAESLGLERCCAVLSEELRWEINSVCHANRTFGGIKRSLPFKSGG